jgi:hypothetical protein
LGLERLEQRDTPTTLTLNVTYGLGRSITLSGNLGDTTNVANQMIMINGEASGQTFTDSKGHFATTLTANALGTVSAQTMDNSASASVTLTDEKPVITNFSAIPEGYNIYEFKGTVTYSRPFTSLVIFFGGMPVDLGGKVTAADSHGNFDLMVQLNGQQSDNGVAEAVAMTAWNTYSDSESSNYIWQAGT